MVCPHPHGHLNPTHQSSWSSLAKTSDRIGILAGSESPLITLSFRAGRSGSSVDTMYWQSFFSMLTSRSTPPGPAEVPSNRQRDMA